VTDVFGRPPDHGPFIAWSAQREAADNLLSKAGAAVRAGDGDRADRLVRTAVAQGMDEVEGVLAALDSAHQTAYDVLCDAIEGLAEGDQSWLDALESALQACPADGRWALVPAVVVVSGAYRLPKAEARRVRALLAEHGGVEAEQGGDDVALRLDLPVEDQVRLVRGAVEATALLEAALARSSVGI
jgi:hypothetical protein